MAAAVIVKAALDFGGKVVDLFKTKKQEDIAYQQWLNNAVPQYKDFFKDFAGKDDSFNIILVLAVLAGLVLLAVALLKINKP